MPVLLLLAQTVMAQEAAAPAKQNWFDDPFFQVSAGLPACAVPEGPFYTAEERRVQTHSRLERGTSCWLAGKCADSNAYRYDKPLAPKVRAALRAVPGVRKASVWVMVQRRWVYLQGCVPNAALGKRLERAARALPDVEAVARPDDGHARQAALPRGCPSFGSTQSLSKRHLSMTVTITPRKNPAP